MSLSRYAEVHLSPQGAGDARPTALQIVQDAGLVNAWADKVVLITGCSSGIGIETARALKATGAKVYATVRNITKGEKALADVLEPGRCELLELDLNSLASVRKAAAEFQRKEPKLNVLINNAGIMNVVGETSAIKQVTGDGFEAHFGVNHLAHFLLFQLLKPQLLAASTPTFNSRVVNLSSAAHRFTPTLLDDPNFEKVDSYDPWKAYGSSKTANIWMTNYIEREFGSGNVEAVNSGKAIHGNSVHPGAVITNLGGQPIDWAVYKKRDPTIMERVKNADQGAATSVWAAVAPEWEGKGGKYLADVQISPIIQEAACGKLAGPEALYWVYDAEGERKQWELSNKLIGFRE